MNNYHTLIYVYKIYTIIYMEHNHSKLPYEYIRQMSISGCFCELLKLPEYTKMSKIELIERLFRLMKDNDF